MEPPRSSWGGGAIWLGTISSQPHKFSTNRNMTLHLSRNQSERDNISPPGWRSRTPVDCWSGQSRLVCCADNEWSSHVWVTKSPSHQVQESVVSTIQCMSFSHSLSLSCFLTSLGYSFSLCYSFTHSLSRSPTPSLLFDYCSFWTIAVNGEWSSWSLTHFLTLLFAGVGFLSLALSLFLACCSCSCFLVPSSAHSLIVGLPVTVHVRKLCSIVMCM